MDARRGRGGRHYRDRPAVRPRFGPVTSSSASQDRRSIVDGKDGMALLRWRPRGARLPSEGKGQPRASWLRIPRASTVAHFKQPYEIYAAAIELDSSLECRDCQHVTPPSAGTTWAPRARGAHGQLDSAPGAAAPAPDVGCRRSASAAHLQLLPAEPRGAAGRVLKVTACIATAASRGHPWMHMQQPHGAAQKRLLHPRLLA